MNPYEIERIAGIVSAITWLVSSISIKKYFVKLIYKKFNKDFSGIIWSIFLYPLSFALGFVPAYIAWIISGVVLFLLF